MRASLTVAGIEVELVVPAGPLEQVVAGRYTGFLGTPSTAVCTLKLEPAGRLDVSGKSKAVLVKRNAATRFEVVHSTFAGSFELKGRGMVRAAIAPDATDEALRTLFALLAPLHDGLLLRATGLIERGQAQVFMGTELEAISDSLGTPLALPGGYVMVRRVADGWVAASTPFQKGIDRGGFPREARLVRLSALVAAASRFPLETEQLACVVEENVVLPSSDDESRRAVHVLATALATSMPCTPLLPDSLPGSDQRLVSVTDPAEVTNGWQ